MILEFESRNSILDSKEIGNIMKLSKLTVAIYCATGLYSLSAVAQAQESQTDNTLLPAVTVSASPIHDHQAFEVPSQIDSISGEQKMAQDSGSLGKMLESIPGVNNQSTGLRQVNLLFVV